MEKNKRFISILTVCLISVLAVLPLFAVPVSASPTYTSPDYYHPCGNVFLTLYNYDSDPTSYSSWLHSSLTHTSGSIFTHTEFLVAPDLSHGSILHPLELLMTVDDEDIINEYYNYTSNFQRTYCETGILTTRYLYLSLTLFDFYLFDDYFDFLDNSVTSSIEFLLDTENNSIYSSDFLGSCSFRFREAGDLTYSTVNTTSHIFTPSVPSLVDAQNNTIPVETGTGSSSIRLSDFTNHDLFDEGKLYHFDYLTLDFVVDQNSLGNPDYFAFQTDITYTDINGIDNVVTSIDKSTSDIPDVDLGSWLGRATTGFFSAEFIPGFSFGALVVVVLSFALLIWFLKLFAGG